MKKQRPLLRGSMSDKMEQIERYLRHIKLRRANYVIGVTPPIPVFDWTMAPDDDGVVFRKLMPGNGVITVGCMWIGLLDMKQSPQAILTIEDFNGGNTTRVPITRQAISIQPNLQVNFGQRLTLAVSPVEACKDIWTAFLFECSVEHTQTQKQLMDGFLELVDRADEELENAGI